MQGVPGKVKPIWQYKLKEGEVETQAESLI